MDYMTIAEDSPIQRATVEGKKLRAGRDAVALTKDEAKRLEDIGVKLVKGEKPEAETDASTSNEENKT